MKANKIEVGNKVTVPGPTKNDLGTGFVKSIYTGRFAVAGNNQWADVYFPDARMGGEWPIVDLVKSY